jgi:glutathione S-transferase
MDSQKINEYLEAQYPGTHALYPAGTRALQAAWVYSITPRMTVQTLFPLLIMCIHDQASESGKKYFRDTRREMFGVELEQIEATGAAGEAKLKAWEALLAEVGGYIDANGAGALFVGGDKPINADLDVAAVLTFCIKTGGKDHAASQLALTTGGGRWARYLEAFEKWSAQN